MVTVEDEPRLTAFLASLDRVPWFAEAGHPSTKYHVAADAVVAWDDWNKQMLDVWVSRSERLEGIASDVIGDEAIERVFSLVDMAIEPAVRNGLKEYFARRPDNTENTAVDADLGLWPDILDFVLRDMSWAAIETILDQPDFFVSLIQVHREGRWPCSWKGRYPKGQFVVL